MKYFRFFFGKHTIQFCDTIATIMTSTPEISSRELSNSHPVACLLTEAAPETFGTLPNALWSHILTFLGGPVEMKIKDNIVYKLVSYQDLMGKMTKLRLLGGKLGFILRKEQELRKACGFSTKLTYKNPMCMVESLEIWNTGHRGITHRDGDVFTQAGLRHAVTKVGTQDIPYYNRKPTYYHITVFSPTTSIMRMQIVLPTIVSREYYPKGREAILIKNTAKNEKRMARLVQGVHESKLPKPIAETFAPRVFPCFGGQFYKEWTHAVYDVCNMRPAINIRYKKTFGWCLKDDKDWLQDACTASQLMTTKPVEQYWKEDADFQKYSKVQLTYNLSKIRVKNGVKLRPDEMFTKLQKLEAGGAEIIGKPSPKTCEMALLVALMVLALRLACEENREDLQSNDRVANGPSKCNANKETFDSAKIPPPPERVGKIISGPGFCML